MLTKISKGLLGVLGKTDIGLGNVDNTSDANKPVSTATTAALSSKANLTDLSSTAAGKGLSLIASVGGGNAQDYIDGSVYRVGLWSNFENYPLRQAVTRIITSGHSVNNRGSAVYRLSDDQTSAAQAWRKKNISNDKWYEIEPLVGGLTPMHFGAVGDYNMESPTGGTDDSVAVSDWMNFAMSRGSFIGYPVFIDRYYVVTQNNFLAKWTINALTLRGFSLKGNSKYACGFVFRPAIVNGVTDYYCLDGYSGSGVVSQARRLLFTSFENFRIIFDPVNLTTERVHFARQSGWTADNNPQQGWSFRDMWFSWSGTKLANNGDLLQIIGTSNGSENSFTSCRAQRLRSAIVCDNPQAVNQMVSDCHWELTGSHVYNFIRGGALTHTGGSIIIGSFASTTTWAPGTVATLNQLFHYDGRGYTADSAGALGGAGGAVFTGSVTDGVLDVSGVTSGTIVVGMELVGTGMPAYVQSTPGVKIIAQITGTGGVGTYLVSTVNVVASGTITGYAPPVHTTGSVDGMTYVSDDSSYLLTIGGDGTGQINDFVIIGARIEFRNATAKVFRSVGTNVSGRVKLEGVNSASVVGGYRTTFEFGDNGAKVNISGGGWCRIGGYDEPVVISFANPSSSQVLTAEAPSVTITGGAQVSKDIHDLVRWGGSSSAGTVTIDDSVKANGLLGASDNTAKYRAPDRITTATLYNPAGTGTSAKGMSSVRRRITYRMLFYSFPSTGGTSNPDGKRSRIKVQPGAVIEGIRCYKSGSGGNGQPLTLRLVNDDDNTVIATLPAIASASAGFDVKVDSLSYVVPRNKRTLRVDDIGTGGDAGLLAPVTDTRFIEITMTIS